MLLNENNCIVLDQAKSSQDELYTIKTPVEIQKMKEAGKICAKILTELEEYIRPGMTTCKLEIICRDLIVNKYKAEIDRTDLNGRNCNDISSFSFSRNFVTAFGELDDSPFKHGEIFGIDISIKKDGYCGDTGRQWIIGQETSRLARSLLNVGYEAMWKGINMVKPGIHIGTIGSAVENYVESKGFSIMRTPGQFGHSIGKVHNEGLLIPFYGTEPYTGHVLKEGMVITIEPGVTYGNPYGYRFETPMGTMTTSDKSILGCYWEHVVAVVHDGFEVLDLREGESEFPDANMYGYNPALDCPHI